MLRKLNLIRKKNPSQAHAGDLAQLVGLSHKSFLFTLERGGEFQTHRGVLKHDDLIGKPWGSQVFSHNGSPFFLLQPALNDILKKIKRATQIMYPKEIGYVLMYMGIGPGKYVIEAGTGSGSLTTALAFMVGDLGHVYSYEVKEATQKVAINSIEKLGLSERVDFKVKDICDGFDEESVDCVFLDVANSYDYLKQVKAALKPGGYFGSILPTTNQVTKLLIALRQYDFAFIEVCDISVKYYKTEPSRFRPTDRMVAHTGYLIFARSVIIDREHTNLALLKEAGMFSIENEPVLETNEGPDDSVR